jgi:DNA-binding FadR family transcriptional regulator
MAETAPRRPSRALDEINAHVRERIATGQLKPGDKLPPERELAAKLQVSRPILREALRTLEKAGLLEFRKGRRGGAFVTGGNGTLMTDYMSDMVSLGAFSLSELTEVRLWVEETVIRVACERATEADFAALEQNVREAEALFAAGRLAEKTQKVVAFHEVLAAATRNPAMVLLMRSLGSALSYFTRMGSETTRAVFLSRRRFLRALRARDAEAATREMARNLRRVERLYTEMPRARFAPSADWAPDPARVGAANVATPGQSRRRPKSTG